MPALNFFVRSRANRADIVGHVAPPQFGIEFAQQFLPLRASLRLINRVDENVAGPCSNQKNHWRSPKMAVACEKFASTSCRDWSNTSSCLPFPSQVENSGLQITDRWLLGGHQPQT